MTPSYPLPKFIYNTLNDEKTVFDKTLTFMGGMNWDDFISISEFLKKGKYP